MIFVNDSTRGTLRYSQYDLRRLEGGYMQANQSSIMVKQWTKEEPAPPEAGDSIINQLTKRG